MVTDDETKAVGTSNQELIRERKQIIERAIAEYRQARAPWHIARNVGSLIATWISRFAEIRGLEVFAAGACVR